MAHADDSGAPEGQGGQAGGMEEIRVKIPAEWKRQLQQAADAQAIDLSDVVRIVLRGFLRERYGEQGLSLG